MAGLSEREHATGAERKALGAWDTPVDVVERVLDLALDPILAERSRLGIDAVASVRVLDPSCGSGNFLVAAGRRIAATLRGLDVKAATASSTAFAECVAGVDVDPAAVDGCRRALQTAAAEMAGRGALTSATGGAARAAGAALRVRVGDALVGDLSRWTAAEVDEAAGGGAARGPSRNSADPRHLFEVGPDAGDLSPGSGPRPAKGMVSPSVDWSALVERSGPAATSGFDLVVGNPPFLNPRQRRTALSAIQVEAMRVQFGEAVGSLTDPAVAFLVLGVRLARPGGTVCLIEPMSVLSARTAASARADVIRRAGLVGLWVAEEQVFDLAVDVCAPILRCGTDAGREVRLYRGRSFEPVTTANAPAERESWSELAATAIGLPERRLATDGVLADIAHATADFRDQYYGLIGHVAEQNPQHSTLTSTGRAESVQNRSLGSWAELDADRPAARVVRLVTTGLVDPAELAWGERSARIHKVDFRRPVVLVDELDEAMAAWAARRLVPKVVVASQTKVIEALVDSAGALLPSVPLVTVTARSGSAEDLWRISAVLSSPPATLVAARRHIGAARARGALKLSASDLLALALPAHEAPWAAAAEHIRAAHGAPDADARRRVLVAAARSMLCAYGLDPDDDLLAWWTDRLPRRTPRHGA
ncbi:MAG: Eco57I restriction-modification methylase domain-containing protein [Acidimicrobiales bacterium]